MSISLINVKNHKFIITQQKYPWNKLGDSHYTISRISDVGTANQVYYFYEFDEGLPIKDEEVHTYESFYFLAIKKFRKLKAFL